MPRTVLILEDSHTQAAIIGKLFERAGFEPVLVSDHIEAVVELRRRPCDLMVLDVYLAGDNSLENLDTYRRMAPDTPIAVMTAGRRDDPLAASNALNKARRSKVDFLLPKPFSFDDIEQICSDAVRMRYNRNRGGSTVLL